MTEDQIKQLKACGFNKQNGKLMVWAEILKIATLNAAVEHGVMIRKFYQHLYGHEDYILTAAGRAVIL